MQYLSQNIFKNKAQLMGISICLIMLYHSNLKVDYAIVSFFKDICDIGVDMFLFLSGFSCANSFAKNPDIKTFYRKRLTRILPAYLIVATLWYSFHYVQNPEITWHTLLFNISTLNFFIDGSLDFWYIPVIIVFYFLLPPYVLLIKKYKICRFLPHFIIIASIILASLHFFKPQSFLYLRLPIYLIGINTFIFKNNFADKLNYISLGAITIIAIIGCFYVINIDRNFFQLKYLLYIPIVMFVFKISESMPSRIFSVIGTYTLELYLLHERIQWFLDKYIENQYFLFATAVCLSMIGAYILNYMLKWIKGLCKMSKRPQ